MNINGLTELTIDQLIDFLLKEYAKLDYCMRIGLKPDRLNEAQYFEIRKEVVRRCNGETNTFVARHIDKNELYAILQSNMPSRTPVIWNNVATQIIERCVK